MRNRRLALTALLATAAMGVGHGTEGEFYKRPKEKPLPPEDKETQLRRELAEVRGHRSRLHAATEKRARKNAKRRRDALHAQAGKKGGAA